MKTIVLVQSSPDEIRLYRKRNNCFLSWCTPHWSSSGKHLFCYNPSDDSSVLAHTNRLMVSKFAVQGKRGTWWNTFYIVWQLELFTMPWPSKWICIGSLRFITYKALHQHRRNLSGLLDEHFIKGLWMTVLAFLPVISNARSVSLHLGRMPLALTSVCIAKGADLQSDVCIWLSHEMEPRFFNALLNVTWRQHSFLRALPPVTW